MNLTQPPSREQQLEFETKSGRVYRALRDDILNGILKPATRLIRKTLGKQYGTSAIAVAEALWKLENDGLVESEPMYGSRVSTFTLKQIQSEMLLRQALETEVARLCAQRCHELPADQLMEAAVALDAIMSTKREGYRREDLEMHYNFHMSLAQHCGSDAIVAELDRVWFRQLMIFNWVNSSLFPVPPDWHQRLLRAILSGDPDHADSIMRKHIEYGKDQQPEVLQKLNSMQSV